jgi:trigger factor
VEDRAVETGDYLNADVDLKLGEEVVGSQKDGQLVVRAGRLAGIQIDDLDKQLGGAKAGETRTLNVKAPESHSNEKIRGKDVQIVVTVKDIRRLELAEINQMFLEDLGFDNEQGLRDALREQMDEKITYDIQQAMREQVNRFLLENTHVELPYKMSTKQADRVINRRAVDLMQRGVSREEIQANLERLRYGAVDEAVRELKLFFILQKIATDMEVDVSEGELNGRVAMIAAQRDRRPEKVKQEMTKDGSLADLYVQMREQKAVDKILEKAQVEEVEMTPKEGEAAAAPASADAPPEGSAAASSEAPKDESAPQA